MFGASNEVLADQQDAATTGVSGEPAPGDAPKSLPPQNVLSSIMQSLRMGDDHEVVRGHFDLGAPPNVRRYFCLIDTKTGSREPNGVLGQRVALPDGTTGLKIEAVSLYGCENAEKQGMLVTAGYLLKGPSGAATAPPTAPRRTQPQPQPSPTGFSPEGIDVAGVKLGMSLDEVRAVLKSKPLREYNEATETLSYLDAAKGGIQSITNGRFVNVIAAWTPPAVGDGDEGTGEAYEVMFTPTPGKERVMAIVHSVGYSPANAVNEVTLETELVKKYGGFTQSSSLPESPTWRVQSGGNVQVGDPCNRRDLFGGLGGLTAASPARANLALKKSPDEFRFQIDHCGVAIVTEDHFTANGGALLADRLVTRFTVTAYSPSIALEATTTAAQLIQAAGGMPGNADARRTKNQSAPNL